MFLAVTPDCRSGDRVEQFERVQVLLGKTSRARVKTHVFAYSGLMRCGSCGGSITAEEKVNRYGSHYTYYHCTHRKRDIVCNEKCAEEGQLQEQILLFLNSIYLVQQELDRLLAVIEDERVKESHDGGGIKQAVQSSMERCARNLDNLTKLRYRDLIGDEEFIRQRADLTQEQSKLKQRLQRLNTEQWIEPSRNLFLFSNRAAFWLTHGTASERRLILSSIGSNLALQNKKLSIDAKEPFRILQKHRSFTNPLRERVSNLLPLVLDRFSKGMP
jgi:site-specific DNA recombinase